MQTQLPIRFLETDEGQLADQILRSCVHCGFCNATCPTFLLTGNELDGPRGRIYLIKEMLEQGSATSKTTQHHLDRCLTCQACETTCPSNVQYHRLLDIGRQHVEVKIGRSAWANVKQYVFRKLFSNQRIFSILLSLGRLSKPFLSRKLKRAIPSKVTNTFWPKQQKSRKMILLNGCVQQSLSPQTNVACARILEKLDIEAIPLAGEGCCGALSYHLNAQSDGLKQAKHNIDLLHDQIERGVEALISTASGCGNFIKDYASLLENDADYKDKAKRVSEYCKDISEVIVAENLSKLKIENSQSLAIHCPCSLQHGQQLNGVIETILSQLGFTFSETKDSHLCCGSAGTYSLLQPALSKQLQSNKIKALEEHNPDSIVTANVGCQNHLSAVSAKPVKHWIEIVAEGIKA